MKLNYKIIIPTTLLLIITSACGLSSSNFKNRLNWLSGTWESNHQNIIAQEKWKWDSKNEEYHAQGYMVNEKDTLYNQTMKIHEEDDELFLSVHTSDNSTQKEAFFKLIRYDADSLVFKNIFKVNPKFIIYANKSPYLHTKAIVEKKGHTELDVRKYKKLNK